MNEEIYENQSKKFLVKNPNKLDLHLKEKTNETAQ